MLMKIDPKYKLREVAGECIIVNQGKVGTDLTRIISLNSTANYLYKAMEAREFEVEDAAQALVDEYGIDNDLAMKDAGKWVESLKNCGVIS